MKVIKNCLGCNREFAYDQKNGIKRKFCTKQCYQRFQHLRLLDKDVEAKEIEKFEIKFSWWIRLFLITGIVVMFTIIWIYKN